MPLVKVAQIDDVMPETGKVIHANGTTLALFNIGGKFHAIDNKCPHAGASLGDGAVEGTIVTCPLHASRFDVTTGAVLQPPAKRPVAAYPVRVQGGEVFVELP